MRKFTIKLTRDEQEALLTVLVNYNIDALEDVIIQHMIMQLGGGIVKKLGSHLRDVREHKDWTLTLHHGEAAALHVIMMHLQIAGAFASNLANKIWYALHAYFTNLKMPGITDTVNLEEHHEARQITE